VSKIEPRFKVGDKVTYKSKKECGGSYYLGGDDQEGFIGKVIKIQDYCGQHNCYEITVTAKFSNYEMLECEFKEYDTMNSLPEYWYLPEIDVTKPEVIDLINHWRGGHTQFIYKYDSVVLVNKHKTDYSKFYYANKRRFEKEFIKIFDYKLITEEQFVAHFYPNKFESIFNKSINLLNNQKDEHQRSSKAITFGLSQAITRGQKLSGAVLSGKTQKAAITSRQISHRAIIGIK
jgi:hypothetical protein